MGVEEKAGEKKEKAKSYPDQLHEIFMKWGFRPYSEVETEAALLIDKIYADADKMSEGYRREIRELKGGYTGADSLIKSECGIELNMMKSGIEAEMGDCPHSVVSEVLSLVSEVLSLVEGYADAVAKYVKEYGERP